MPPLTSIKGAQSVCTLDRVAVVFESQPPFYFAPCLTLPSQVWWGVQSLLEVLKGIAIKSVGQGEWPPIHHAVMDIKD